MNKCEDCVHYDDVFGYCEKWGESVSDEFTCDDFSEDLWR